MGWWLLFVEQEAKTSPDGSKPTAKFNKQFTSLEHQKRQQILSL